MACGLAPNLAILVAARLGQGVGAALLLPNSLAILSDTFTGEARGRAVGTWSAAGAATAAIGPVFGGWLIDGIGWRAMFLVNLPLAFGAAFLAWRYVSADRAADDGHLDIGGAILATLGLGAMTWGLIVGSGDSRVSTGRLWRFSPPALRSSSVSSCGSDVRATEP